MHSRGSSEEVRVAVDPCALFSDLHLYLFGSKSRPEDGGLITLFFEESIPTFSNSVSSLKHINFNHLYDSYIHFVIASFMVATSQALARTKGWTSTQRA